MFFSFVCCFLCVSRQLGLNYKLHFLVGSFPVASDILSLSSLLQVCLANAVLVSVKKMCVQNLGVPSSFPCSLLHLFFFLDYCPIWFFFYYSNKIKAVMRYLSILLSVFLLTCIFVFSLYIIFYFLLLV